MVSQIWNFVFVLILTWTVSAGGYLIIFPDPTANPTITPSSAPTFTPTVKPTTGPTIIPSVSPTVNPTINPTANPTTVPTLNPTAKPTTSPTLIPTANPSANPSANPTANPTAIPTANPTVNPTPNPSLNPTVSPSMNPTVHPSNNPTVVPSVNPSVTPTVNPTLIPTATPTVVPTAGPSKNPTANPTVNPTFVPTAVPTSASPTINPTIFPTNVNPTVNPTVDPTRSPTVPVPTVDPTVNPSASPTAGPTLIPSVTPTVGPTVAPSASPSAVPSVLPTEIPTMSPTATPSATPSAVPTLSPSASPTVSPTAGPTAAPSTEPSENPSATPTLAPSASPSLFPTTSPTVVPTVNPTAVPTAGPTVSPSAGPTIMPTAAPTVNPTTAPSAIPSVNPTAGPTAIPTWFVIELSTKPPTAKPTANPSVTPTATPSASPSVAPTVSPTGSPSAIPTLTPTASPSTLPSVSPTASPTVGSTVNPTTAPTVVPTVNPTLTPTVSPSALSTVNPTVVPTVVPSTQPTVEPTSRPTSMPSIHPTSLPSSQPSAIPSVQPSSCPTSIPSVQPSVQPSSLPSSQPSTSPTVRPSSSPSVQPTSCPSSQPSAQPSAQPTEVPSSSPSARPTTQPSSQPTRPTARPTAQPSGPSFQPSLLPSCQPVPNPTAAPTILPTLVPTAEPTTLPSCIPMVVPTVVPSGDPTVVPTLPPTRVPTVVPTVIPTVQPSRAPTVAPTVQPSCVPTVAPTIQPSRLPTAIPTALPSRVPTAVPTAVPSCLPTAIPSALPSRQPTSRPSLLSELVTRKPTARPSPLPSSQPSSQPSQQPSSQPTVRPTSSRPTGVPSGRPSMAPVTTHPTLPGDTNPPTSHPTAAPSYDMDYKSHFTYRDYLVTKAQYEAVPNSFTFSSYYFKGLSVGGQCNNWNDYTTKKLQLPFDDIVITAVTTDIERYSFITKGYERVAVTCTNPAHVSSIVSSLKTGKPFVALCDDYTWRVYQCNGKNVLCVNCKMSCVKSEVCPGNGLVVSPCSTCQNHAAAVSVVNVQFNPIKLNPVFYKVLVVAKNCNSLVVTVNVDKAGYVYCGAFTNGTVLKSVVDINQVASPGAIEPSTDTYMTIYNLSPHTLYNVYCYTSDFSNHIMRLAEAKLTKVVISTDCPRSIVLTKTYDSVVQYSASSTRPESIFTFALDSMPSAPLTVNLRAAIVDCTTNAVISNSLAQVLFPNTFSFTSKSVIHTGEFKLRTSAVGCYQITASATGADAYQTATTATKVVAFGTQPIVPTVISAALSALGGSVVFDFDMPTDLGSSRVPNFASSFPCSQLVTFPGSAQATCKWLNATRVEADLSKSVTKVNVGDIATLKANVVRAQCVADSDCSAYTYASMRSITIATPVPSLKSMAIIYAPMMIWSCDDMTLDPTASYGFGVRKWNSVRWTVTTQGVAQNASAVERYLNVNYPDTTQVAVVPNRFLTRATQWTPSTYNIKLNVTNFLQKSSVYRVSISVDSGIGAVVPQLRLFGVNKIINRWNAVSLFASATYPACAAGLPVLQYRWRVYQGLIYVPAIQSVSLDPRYFKLDAYTLEASTTYTVAVDVFVNSLVVATSSGILQVGQSGVVASIAGGATRTAGAGVIAFDAFGSHDLDYPLAALNYTWSCKVYSPAFGSNCAGFVTTSSSLLTLPAGALIPQVYTITVIATNGAGRSDVASVQLTVLDETVPALQISNQQHRYNRDSKIILDAIVNAPNSAVATSWSSSSLPALNVSSFALTATSAILKQGQSSFQLSLPPFALVAGRAYTFVLQAKYPASSKTATASMNVYINAPPSGGILTVTPTTGAALSTVFLLRSSYWDDAEEDLPLTHVLAYYLLSSTDLIVVKGPDQVSYVSTLLGQGLASRNYQVTCFLKVSDNFGGSTNVSVPVNVTPVATTSLTVAAIGPALSRAVQLVDPTAMIQAVGAATVAINSVDCTVPVACGALNRAPCQNTAMTCGQCLSGYVGVDGDSNVACSTASSVLPIGSSCQSSASCVTKSCVSGMCANIMKSCPGDCGVGGTCYFIDAAGNPVDACFVDDSSCKAICRCGANIAGSDCLKNLWEFNAMSTIRDEMCANILQTVTLQDPSSEIISSRALLVSNVLQDITQISDEALLNCTAALVQTVVAYPVLSCAGAGLTLVTSALSNVLQRGPTLHLELIDSVNAALVALSQGCQSADVVREVPKTIDNENIRFLSVLADRNSVSRLTLSSPRSSLEEFSEDATSTLTLQSIDLTGIETVGISMLVMKNNPRAIPTNSTRFGLHLTAPSLNVASGRRLTSSASQVGFTIVLQNNEPIYYGVIEPSTMEFQCFRNNAPRPYYMTGICSSGLQLNFTCPAMIKGTYKVACPSYVTAPRCTSFTGADYEVDRNCTVVAYTPYNTTCYCKVSTSTNDTRRALQESSSRLLEYSTAFAVVGTNLAETFIEAPSEETVKKSFVILSTLGGLVVVFLIGSVAFVTWDYREQEKHRAQQIKQRRTVRTVNSFFDSIFPDELREGPWYLRFWHHMQLEHPWLSLYAPFHDTSASRTVKWAIAVGSLLVFLFVNALLAKFMFADDGHCDHFLHKAECEEATTVGQYLKACTWHADNASCSFRDPELNFQTTIMLTLIVTVLAMPLQQFWKFCAVHVADYIHLNLQSHRVQPTKAKKTKLVPIRHDEFFDVQTRHATIMRAARLSKARTTMDNVTVVDETNAVGVQIQDEESFYSNNKVFNGKVTSLVHVHRTRYGSLTKSRPQIQEMVISSRYRAQLIQKEVDTIFDLEEREILLMKHFIIDVFTGYKRHIVSRYFLGDNDVLYQRTFVKQQRLFCSIVLPCFAGAMLYYIYSFSTSIGTKSTNLWLLVTLVSVFQMIFLLEPIKIWITWILINSEVGSEVREFCESLSMKSRLILRRTSGLMRDSNAMVQHFNPACRVARMHPALPISRLLMSVNDRDVPVQRAHGWFLYIFLCLSAFATAASIIPEILQESILNFGSAAFINLALMGLGYYGTRFPVAVALALFGMFAVVAFVSLDGAKRLKKLRVWWTKRSRKVEPHDHEHSRRRRNGKVAPHNDTHSNKKAQESRDDEDDEDSVDSCGSDFSHPGLFHKHEKITLKEGHVRKVKHRVTKIRGLRSLAEMNRKFNVLAPADDDVHAEEFEPHEYSDEERTMRSVHMHRDKDKDVHKESIVRHAEPPSKLVSVNQSGKHITNADKVFSNKIHPDSSEKRKVSFSPGGALSSAKSQMVRAFNYGAAGVQRRRLSADLTHSGARRVAPMPLAMNEPAGDHMMARCDSFHASDHELSDTESSYSQTPQKGAQQNGFNGGLVDFFQVDELEKDFDRSWSESNDGEVEDNRVYRMSTQSMDVV